MSYIKFFNEINIKDVPIVGGKNASLGEMYSHLKARGVNVPNGFATTAEAYRYFIKFNQLDDKIRKELFGVNLKNLSKKGAQVRALILKAQFPNDLKNQIERAYEKLSSKYGKKDLSVAVRSSATAEDLPDASFAGQQETFLNIVGKDQILSSVQKCFASLFTDRAISYRIDKGFDHFQIALSAGVQKMIRSDIASSGIMFTLDTETGFKNVILIHSIYGLGENIVQGQVTPDEFIVFKPTQTIIQKRISEKNIKMIYASGGNKTVKNVSVPTKVAVKPSLNDAQVLKLAQWGMEIEKHYNKPMDIEWAIDGSDKQIYIVQARPETVQSARDYNLIEEYLLKEKGKVITNGQSVGSKIGSGIARRILNARDMAQFKTGEILITEMTDPDWEPIMKKAAAIITDKGGRTCHAAIVSRELGVPCVVGTDNASKIIKTGEKITADCSQGEEGTVYAGILKYEIKKTNLKNLSKTKTKVMLNIGSPQSAFSASFLPADGVGLTREEFIIANHIKIHPTALIEFNKLKDKAIKKEIEKLTQGYNDKKEFFVDKLAEGVALIAAAFYPRPIIVRLSDFKSNEYANLLGGKLYEPKEENPMIGFRGASRYYDPIFEPAFSLECKALKKVREEMKLINVKLMVPFVRTVEEAKRVISIFEKYGLKRGKNDLEIYAMAEIPANAILAAEFAKYFDGFSIGSNDLTQLTLGVDRDSSLISHLYDERNPAVENLIKMIIEGGHKGKIKVGLCGQAPSDHPEFAKFLVKNKIDSLSVTTDAFFKAKLVVAEAEEK